VVASASLIDTILSSATTMGVGASICDGPDTFVGDVIAFELTVICISVTKNLPYTTLLEAVLLDDD